ncbi:unnamed protein product [Paramecium sonneborni]|uniref:Uncharacterized protein n=1 Tax=Paramecium sonneborni TaxID=65129 RepID=A0A8S1KYI1_9CILI|nr:unnamed protein product [Paramecium sonneborni]
MNLVELDLNQFRQFKWSGTWTWSWIRTRYNWIGWTYCCQTTNKLIFQLIYFAIQYGDTHSQQTFDASKQNSAQQLRQPPLFGSN